MCRYHCSTTGESAKTDSLFHSSSKLQICNSKPTTSSAALNWFMAVTSPHHISQWHTLILSNWNAVFAWLPVESMIYRFREDYYKAINACNVKCDSTEFIEFMLAIIKFVLTEANNTSGKVAIEKAADKTAGKLHKHFKELYCAFGTDDIFGRNDVAGVCGLPYSAAGKIIAKWKEYEQSGEVEGKGKGTVLPKCGTVPFCFDEIKSIYR